jgi:hypothetical protein
MLRAEPPNLNPPLLSAKAVLQAIPATSEAAIATQGIQLRFIVKSFPTWVCVICSRPDIRVSSWPSVKRGKMLRLQSSTWS